MIAAGTLGQWGNEGRVCAGQAVTKGGRRYMWARLLLFARGFLDPAARELKCASGFAGCGGGRLISNAQPWMLAAATQFRLQVGVGVDVVGLYRLPGLHAKISSQSRAFCVQVVAR